MDGVRRVGGGGIERRCTIVHTLRAGGWDTTRTGRGWVGHNSCWGGGWDLMDWVGGVGRVSYKQNGFEICLFNC